MSLAPSRIRSTGQYKSTNRHSAYWSIGATSRDSIPLLNPLDSPRWRSLKVVLEKRLSRIDSERVLKGGEGDLIPLVFIHLGFAAESILETRPQYPLCSRFICYPCRRFIPGNKHRRAIPLPTEVPASLDSPRRPSGILLPALVTFVSCKPNTR